MHLKRWLTSIAALPLLGLLIYKGGPLLFAVLVSIVAIVALWEYYRIGRIPWNGRRKASIPFIGFAICPLMIWGAYKSSFEIMLGLLVLNVVFIGLISLLQFQSDPNVSDLIKKQVFGIVYVPLFLSSLVMIRNGTAGIAWIFFLLVVIFAGDIAAYYVGSYLGRHKLCPAISPGKTIEGSIGGLAANLVAGSLFKFYFFMQLPWLAAIPFFLLLGVAGQGGDLFESELKRFANVKDSGVILPGHGGILDRIDALLFAAPVAFAFKEYILTL
ncbi:phosphatidate cytidylyltransferase [Thermodesulfobacteriota bacterium]